MEDDIIKCIHFINKIKGHRHNKIKRKQSDNFHVYSEKAMDTCITLAVLAISVVTLHLMDTPKIQQMVKISTMLAVPTSQEIHQTH